MSVDPAAWSERRKRRVAILIFEDVEVLDFAGPFEVFGVARQADGEPAFEVEVFSLDAGVIHARNGLRVLPHHRAEDPRMDLLIVPGGYGVRRLLADDRTHRFLIAGYEVSETTLSVCTGSLLLGACGLLGGLAATTHSDAIDELRAVDAAIDVRPDARMVDNGKVVTSAGISAGIDASLYLVARFCGHDVAAETARYMNYDWRHRVADGVHIVRNRPEWPA